jgi:hypothetical protein
MYVVQNSENDDLIAIFAQKTLLNEKKSLSLPMSFKYSMCRARFNGST